MTTIPGDEWDEHPFPLFHWSPSARRKSIERRGLVPGSRSIDGKWKPPFICFGRNPAFAFEQVSQFREALGITEWDLWMVMNTSLSGYEVLFDDRDDSPKEWRVYERILKRNLLYIATRSLA